LGDLSPAALSGRLNKMRAPFMLGKKQDLEKVILSAGIRGVEIHTRAGKASFPSIDDQINTDKIRWILTYLLGDHQFDRFAVEVLNRLQACTDSEGAVNFSAPAHIAAIVKRQD